MKTRMMIMAAMAALGLAACGGKGKKEDTMAGGGSAAPAGGKLYDRLGGKDAITAVVKEFVENQVAKDARINAFFANADIPGLEAKLVDQICMATGGPCEYKGKDMKTAHTAWASRSRTSTPSSTTWSRRSTSTRCPRRRRASSSVPSAA